MAASERSSWRTIGAVAWRFAMEYASAVEKLIVMNAPHPAALARELNTKLPKELPINQSPSASPDVENGQTSVRFVRV